MQTLLDFKSRHREVGYIIFGHVKTTWLIDVCVRDGNLRTVAYAWVRWGGKA